jgi:hypothetical protein
MGLRNPISSEKIAAISKMCSRLSVDRAKPTVANQQIASPLAIARILIGEFLGDFERVCIVRPSGSKIALLDKYSTAPAIINRQVLF